MYVARWCALAVLFAGCGSGDFADPPPPTVTKPSVQNSIALVASNRPVKGGIEEVVPDRANWPILERPIPAGEAFAIDGSFDSPPDRDFRGGFFSIGSMRQGKRVTHDSKGIEFRTDSNGRSHFRVDLKGYDLAGEYLAIALARDKNSGEICVVLTYRLRIE